jgi:hypothetical protein
MIGFKKLVAVARANGLFVLADNGRLDFMSCRSGKTLLTWSRGRYWIPSTGERGRAATAFDCIEKARAIDVEKDSRCTA